MFAKNRCRVASFSLRCLRLSKRFCKKSQNRCTLRLEFICKLCWNVNSSNFAFYSSSFELCVHLHGIIVLDIFFISPNSRPLPTFLPFPHGTGGSRPGAPHHRRHHPKTPGGGPAPPSSCRVQSTTRGESSAHAHLHVQPGDPPAAAGKAGWGGAEVFGWREVTFLEGVSPRAFFCLAKAWGPDSFFSISRYYWVTFFEWTNTN